MKTYKIIVALILFSIVLSSCTKDVINDMDKEELLSERYVADDGCSKRIDKKNKE